MSLPDLLSLAALLCVLPLAAYVDRLDTLPGVVDVTPINNAAVKTGTTFNLTLGLTTAALSHRFDVTKGAK